MQNKSRTFLFVAVLLSAVCIFQIAAGQDLNLYVDRSAPELSISGYRLDGDILVVNGTAYDMYSGVANVSASVAGKELETAQNFEEGDGGEWVYRYVIPEGTAKYANFNFVAIDNAGNSTAITKTNVELYNVDAKLKYPDGILSGSTVYPEIEGDPVRAVVTVSGRGYDGIEIETYGPDFPLTWDGRFGDADPTPGSYFATVKAYNKVGAYTVSTTQFVVLQGEDAGSNSDAGRYNDVNIFGYAEKLSDDEIVVNGITYKITDTSQIDENVRAGDKVTGLGRYDIKEGTFEVTFLNRIEDKVYNLPSIDIEADEKTGEESFAGLVEAVGKEYIVVGGKVILITDKTQLNCDPADIHPGDFVSGVAEIFSKSGRKAIVLNKAITDKVKIRKAAGHVTAMGDGWVEIDIDGMRFVVTDATVVKGEYQVGDMIVLEYIAPDNEALTITKTEYAPCTEQPAYYYGEVLGIFEDTNEIVIEDLVHRIDPDIYYDLDIAELEVHSYAAAVSLQCNMRVLRVVRNAGETLPEDRLIGTITEIGEKDINKNTPVYIDGEYAFITDKTDIYPEIRENMVAGIVKVGEEIISLTEIPDASINTDDLIDFVGTVSGVFEADDKGNSYVTVNGITYKITPDTVIDQSTGKLQKGATVSGTVYYNSLVHVSVIKEKNEDIDPNNTFVGRIERLSNADESEYQLVVNNAKYTVDDNTLVYADTEANNTIIGVHDKGTFLAIRDYPRHVSSLRPQALIGKIDSVSAKNADGEFSITVAGKEFAVTANTVREGYVAAGMSAVLLYLNDEDGNNTLHSIVSARDVDLNAQVAVYTGKVGNIGSRDENGVGILYVDGYAYAYTEGSYLFPFEEGDRIIFAVSGDEIVSAAKIEGDNIYADYEMFSDEIKSISDRHTDGSYLVTLSSGETISLTDDTLLNDRKTPIEPGVVISGLRFGNLTYIAATYGANDIDVRDAAFSGILENVTTDGDGKISIITVRRHDYNTEALSLSGDEFIPGKAVAGSLRSGGKVLSVTVLEPEVLGGEVVSVGGYVEQVRLSDEGDERQFVIDEKVYTVPENAKVYGNLVENARVSFFAVKNTGEVVSLSVVESFDQGSSIDGQVEEVTSEFVSNPAHAEDWKHIALGGIYNLMSDDSVELNGEIEAGDTVHGFFFGKEREVLAAAREDRTLLRKLGKVPSAVKAAGLGLAVLIGGCAAAFIIGAGKKKFRGTLELLSDSKARIIDPESPEDVKIVKFDRSSRQAVSALNNRKVKGYTQFGKVTKIDIDEL